MVESEEKSRIDAGGKGGKDWDRRRDGDDRTERERVGRVTGIEGRTKRDKNGNRDRVGRRTQGKGSQRPSAPLKIYLQELS